MRRRPSNRSARVVKKLLKRSHSIADPSLYAVQCDGGARMVSATEAVAHGHASLFDRASRRICVTLPVVVLEAEHY